MGLVRQEKVGYFGLDLRRVVFARRAIDGCQGIHPLVA